MSDPLDKLTHWRDAIESDNYAELVDLARETTPALLTAVENVLNLHSPWPSDSENPHRCAGCDADWPHCDTVTAIRDAIGGAQ